MRDGTAVTPWTEVVRGVYDDQHGRLWRAVLAWSGSIDVADEAVAEAFAQLLRRGEEVRDPKAWVWKAAFKLAAGDLQRRHARSADGSTGPSDGDRPAAAHPEPVAAVDRLPDDAIDLLRAMALLTDQQRRCVALVDVAGHTAPSAAALLGTTAATVRVQLMRARRTLRTALADPEVPR